MHQTVTAANYVPSSRSLAVLQAAARRCEGCDLYKNATQTVFGEGPKHADLMLVGETPGDTEDRTGKPFVGRAGQMLNDILDELEVERDEVYVTNAVKHFRYDQVGKRRLHKRPTWREIRACRPWLEAEIEAVTPQVIFCMGATAAQSLMGEDFRVTTSRGQPIANPWATWLVASYHPSAILRALRRDVREKMRREFIEDLEVARGLIRRSS